MIESRLGKVDNGFEETCRLCTSQIRWLLEDEQIDLIQPQSEIYSRWLGMWDKDPKTVKAIYVVQSPVTPFQLHRFRLAKKLNIAPFSDKTLVEQGFLILPKSFVVPSFDKVRDYTEEEDDIVTTIALTTTLKNFLTTISVAKRQAMGYYPVLLLEEPFSSLNLEFTCRPVNLADYIKNDIPYNEMPIKKGDLYYVNLSDSFISRRKIHQFIQHINRKQ